MFETFADIAPTLINTFADIANWMFTYQVEILDYTYTPVGIMLGAGLTLYVTYTIIKYITDIVA